MKLRDVILFSVEVLLLSAPLVLVLLSLALMPLALPKSWSKIEFSIFGILAAISVCFSFYFINDAKKIFYHILIEDYVPFIIMLFTLYTLSHGIKINIKTTPGTLQNVVFLGIASIFASLIGTTGASMLFLQPFLDMNKNRAQKLHLIIFFIFLVANIGGLLTPLGDPPLLLGYLHGVKFTWFFQELFPYWVIYVGLCLSIMACIDKLKLQKEKIQQEKYKIQIHGSLNITLIILTAFVLFVDFDFDFLVPNVCIKNSMLLLFCLLSFLNSKRHKNTKIDFAPFAEVARTFFIIFIVIAPVLFLLEQNSAAIREYINQSCNGSNGAMTYFWLCSLASSFLDNAPSYLLFFNMAGGNAYELMTQYSDILKAISVSAVVMGSMTYIGNAPNMMVRSIAERKGVKMPSFIGYILWSSLIILPISFVISLIICK